MTYYKQDKLFFAESRQNSVLLCTLIIFGLFLLSVLYLTQINGMVAKNFELRAAQNILREKQALNQQVMISLTRARSLNSLASAAQKLDLVAIESVDYLKIVPGFFALSKSQ